MKINGLLVGALSLVLFVGLVTPSFAATPDVRALDINTNRIIQIDPTTGNVLGGFTTPDPGINLVSGLTFAEGGTTILFQNGNSPGTPSNLYRLNPNNGANVLRAGANAATKEGLNS